MKTLVRIVVFLLHGVEDIKIKVKISHIEAIKNTCTLSSFQIGEVRTRSLLIHGVEGP